MWTPDVLWTFAVRETHSGYVVKGIHLMICRLMHWFMEFWNGGNEFCSWTRLDLFWPMRVDSFEEVDEPLACDVVADEDDGYKKLLNGRAEDIIHVRISGQYSDIRNLRSA